MPVKQGKENFTINIKLTPNAKKNSLGEVIDIGDGKLALKVTVKSIPEDGKANKELIEFLAKTWKIPKSNIEIISGHTSRIKTLSVIGNYEYLLQTKLK